MIGIHAVLLANRPMPALAVLSGDNPPVLLPVGGKPLIVHALEDLAQAKVRQATIVCPAEDPASLLALHGTLGDGVRWGLDLRYIMATPEAVINRPFEVIAPEQDTLLLMELDRARSPFVEKIGAAPARQSSVLLKILTTGGTAGLTLVPREATETMSMFLPGQSIRCETTAGYFAANLSILEGRIPGLLMDGTPIVEEDGDRLIVERGAKVSADMLVTGRVHVGAFAQVGRDTRLSGRVSIGADAFVGSNTELHDSIILPSSRVATGLRLDGMIVAGPLLVDPLSGLVVDAGDPALLGTTNE